MPKGKLVFLDESGVKTNMTRRYGRAVGKKRVYDNAPITYEKSTTIISSIRLDGDTVYKTISGGMKGEDFRAYVNECLLPTLQKGDIVIMVSCLR
jgi:hypothetical protein